MRIGVVSDTHNNVRNIKKLIHIFNKEKVDKVIHTGDISKAKSLELFSKLNAPLIGVYGNNDRIENGLEEIALKYSFYFQQPPLSVALDNKKIAVFHEPDEIEDYVKEHNDLDLVLHGHTHRFRQETKRNTIYFNPGESAGFLEGKSVLGIVDLRDLSIKRIFF
jgi:putative phosphoesterase